MDAVEHHQADQGEARARRLRNGLVVAGAALGLSVAGVGVAAAQEDGGTTTTQPPAERPAPDAGPRAGHKLRIAGFGHHGPGVFGMGMGMGIHGEATVRGPDGGYQTVATQVGEVTEVSRSSITVRSEDGYSRTYRVDDNTLVNAGNDGIADVRQGDQVHVTAIVADGNARAVDVRDVTQTKALRDQWAPPPRD